MTLYKFDNGNDKIYNYTTCPIQHKIVKLQETISLTKVYGLVICKFTKIIT